MKRLAPTGYVPAEQSRKPGYLARRMAAYRLKIALEKEAAERAQQEAQRKVRQIKVKA